MISSHVVKCIKLWICCLRMYQWCDFSIFLLVAQVHKERSVRIVYKVQDLSQTWRKVDSIEALISKLD